MFGKVSRFLLGIVIGSIIFVPMHDEIMREQGKSDNSRFVMPVLRAISNTFWKGVKAILPK